MFPFCPSPRELPQHLLGRSPPLPSVHPLRFLLALVGEEFPARRLEHSLRATGEKIRRAAPLAGLGRLHYRMRELEQAAMGRRPIGERALASIVKDFGCCPCALLRRATYPHGCTRVSRSSTPGPGPLVVSHGCRSVPRVRLNPVFWSSSSLWRPAGNYGGWLPGNNRAARSSRPWGPRRCQLRSAWPDQRQGGDVSPLAAVVLHVVDDCHLGFRQPDGGLLAGENRVMVVIGRVAAILEVVKRVREYLGSRGELLAMSLELPPGRPVVKAAVYPRPSCCGYPILGRADQGVGVAGGQGVEQCIVGAADRASDVFVRGSDTFLLTNAKVCCNAP